MENVSESKASIASETPLTYKCSLKGQTTAVRNIEQFLLD
jgi:hypothetical protein